MVFPTLDSGSVYPKFWWTVFIGFWDSHLSRSSLFDLTYLLKCLKFYELWRICIGGVKEPTRWGGFREASCFNVYYLNENVPFWNHNNKVIKRGGGGKQTPTETTIRQGENRPLINGCLGNNNVIYNI